MVTLSSVRSVGAAPARRGVRVVGAAIAVIAGVLLGVAMADLSAAIMRSSLLSVGVAVIGARAFRATAARRRLSNKPSNKHGNQQRGNFSAPWRCKFPR